ncbi:DoxX family protein [Terriglobus aquaticus]|uniref:DoxX family membrane protein n=1 Tax=Terriglobus aquaticus TaxID=940139 RepID=A0ABW9KPN2_9BACT|nr:hypothetical protein [Terriglobus aquaticus]
MNDASIQLEPRSSEGSLSAQRLLGAILGFTGTGHLTFLRKPFHAQVPPGIPLTEDQVVALSGPAELLLAASLLLAKSRKTRVPVGWAAAAFFVAIFPGNIAQWQYHRNAFGLNTDTKRFLRLFGQPVLIAWALWATGALRSGDASRSGEASR